ncbi:MAG TPA: hypothetical protein ENK23_07815 [Sorangium sp.]|nr:hypothetical protein [Sorangium sp.]
MSAESRAPALPTDDAAPLSRRVLAIPVARQLRARSATLRCTLAALAAWAITLAPLLLITRAGPAVRITAALALLPAVVGPQLLLRRHRLARHIGISALLSLALLSWGLATRDGVLVTLDGFHGVLGAGAWGVYALSWSHPWSVPDSRLTEAPEGATMGLAPRRRPPVYAVVVVVIGLLCAVGCMAVAWTIEDSQRAVLGQALSVACAVALVTSASTVAVLSGKAPSGRVRLPFDRKVANTLLLLFVVLGVALTLHLSDLGLL